MTRGPSSPHRGGRDARARPQPQAGRNPSTTVRWLFWMGGLLAVGGLWWLFQGVDLAAGGQGDLALVGGSLVFLVGLVLLGLGMGLGEIGR